jgi:mRNA-degrading endonuclease RelE of RelBE toxin-antitoxin system
MNINKIIEQEINNLTEDYPTSFDMDHFKTLTSFNKRKQYCDEHLQKIKAGSSRIVYKIDDQKVLKLAYNAKGLAQNEVEVEYSSYYSLEDIVAKVFDHHEKYYWHEMELARKITKPEFEKIVGIDFENYSDAMIEYGKNRSTKKVPEHISDFMWNKSEFCYEMLNFIGSYDIYGTDLAQLTAYGIVKRDGQDTIVLIDYGLNEKTFSTHYLKQSRW